MTINIYHLERDSQGDPAEAMPLSQAEKLLCMLKEEEHLKAVCAECGPVNRVSGLMRGGYDPLNL